jgi:hypothetical protein
MAPDPEVTCVSDQEINAEVCTDETNTLTVPLVISPLGITNLTDGSKIALTNTRLIVPQPNTNERKPRNRRLRVSGTASGSNAVDVNGQQVNVVNGSWNIELPIPGLGPFRITVSEQTSAGAAGGQQTITVHIFEIAITRPSENQVFTLQHTPPGMPRIEAEARINGHPSPNITSSTAFRWRLLIGGYYRTRPDPRWESYERTINFNITGPGPWIPTFDEFIGGWGKLTLEADVPDAVDGPRVTSDPIWIDLQGGNPPRADVLGFIQANGGQDADIIAKIMCHESAHNFLQFRGGPETREPEDARIPVDWRNPRRPLRPLYGAPPAGIGIAQLDPASFPASHWNWQTNVRDGISKHNSNRSAASTLHSREQQRVDRERHDAETRINQNRSQQQPSLPAITIPNTITVPILTPDRLRREKIRRYNGGRNYRFDAHYVITPNALNSPTPIGTQQWVEDPGTWESEQRWINRGGVTVRRIWNQLPGPRIGYVNSVEACNP